MSFSNTNFNLYRAFIAVYETQSAKKAGEILNTSHSAISQAIRDLTRQVGVKLFTSNNKGVYPTSDGIDLYQSIKPALDYIKTGEERIQTFTNESVATIRVIMPATMSGFILADYFKQFNEEYPNVNIKIFNMGAEENFNLFKQGELDFVIGLENSCKKYNLKTIPVMPFHFVVLASKSFLEERGLTKNMQFSDFVKLPIVGYHEHIREIFGTQDIKANIFIETATIGPVLQLVQSGVGVGVFFKELLNVHDSKDDLVELNIKGLNMTGINIVCGYRQGFLTKAAQKFIDGLVDYCSKYRS